MERVSKPLSVITDASYDLETGAKKQPRKAENWQTEAFETVVKKHAIILSAPEVYAECSHLGYEKSKYPLHKSILLGIIAGMYAGIGATTCLLVAGTLNQAPNNPRYPSGQNPEKNIGAYRILYGVFGFPLGFLAITTCGAELFTSLTLYTSIAWWEGKISLFRVWRMLFVSWCSNFIGCGIVTALYYWSDIYDGQEMTLFNIVKHKMELPWVDVMVLGIFANMLVCMATWMYNSALDFTGKVFAVWFPIASFAMCSYEHSIANMFYLLMAVAQGYDISTKDIFWKNLIPSTIGNMIGASLLFTSFYTFTYGKPDLKFTMKRLYNKDKN